MNVNKLKIRFQKELGIIDHNLSDSDLIEIISQVKLLPKKERTKSKIQQIVTKVAGIDYFLLLESSDNSDIDYLLDQIEDALKKLE